MKKIFIIAALVLAATLNLSAQNYWKNEIGISYGFGALTDVSSSYLKGIFSGKQTNYIGAFGAEYFYRRSIVTTSACTQNWRSVCSSA